MPVSEPTHDLQSEPAFNGIWSRSYRRLTAGLTLIVTVAAFEALAIATVLPAVARDLGGLRLYGWVFSAFMLANLVGLAVAGGEADRRGPAGLFLIGVALFVLGLVSAGMATSMGIVVASRAIQGFGAGAISSLVYVCIGRDYPESVRGKMLAVMSSAWVMPGLVGPALAGLIAEHAGWRWVFLGIAPLPILAAALILPALRPLSPPAAQNRDHRRTLDAIQLAAGTGMLLSGLSGRSALLALLILPGIALGWPALRRLLPPGTLTAQVGVPAAIATIGLLNLAFFGVDAFVPLSLISVRGQKLGMAGLAVTLVAITWAAGSWVQAHLASQQSRKALVTVGLLLLAAGVVGVAGALSPTFPAVTIAFAWGVAGLGMGLAYSTAKLVILENVPSDAAGAFSASMQIMDVLGAAIGTCLAGVIVGYASIPGRTPRTGILLVDILMACVLGFTLLTASRLPGRRPV